jgi:peptidoglycan/LPS O-acetylase OafA/YrhL
LQKSFEAEQLGASEVDDPGKRSRAEAGIPVLPALDGLRALAIFGIVALHVLGDSADSSGERIFVFGVLPNMIDVLFIISGFVVFLPTVAREGEFGSVRNYALRRGARLLPAFWLAIVVVLAMLALWPGVNPPIPSALDIGVHLVGMQAYGQLLSPDFNLGLLIDGPLWTLTLELTFYAVLPLIASAYYRRPLLGLLAAAALTVGWKLGFAHLGDLLSLVGLHPSPADLRGTELRAIGQFPAFAFQFGLGMTAAWALVRLRAREDQRALGRWAVVAQGVSLVAAGVAMYLFGRHAIDFTALAATRARTDILLTLVLPAAIATFLLATCLAPRPFQMPFALPVARRLGDISYGVYLIHLPLLLFAVAAFAPGTPAIGPLGTVPALALIVVPASIAYGYLSARFLEMPIRRWAHRYGRREEPVRVAARPARG